VRAAVVGEGGNLGLTQRGRVEYAQRGGRLGPDGERQARLNTDFIDNSAGVDCSDHEVNLKILLGGAVADLELSMAERDELLAAMTDEVAALVLRDNYDQARALGTARAQTRPLLPVHRRMIVEMERAGQLDRTLEALPAEEELEARAAAGAGLTTPETAVLLAHTKMRLKRELVESGLPDEEWTHEVLTGYFPTPLRERFAHRMPGHRLRREIVTTSVVNETVNRCGTSFMFRATEETGAAPADVIRAFVVVRDVFGLDALWHAVEELDNRVPTTAQTEVLLDVRRLVDRAVRWLVTNRRCPIDVTAETARLRPGVTLLMGELEQLLQGRERGAVREQASALAARGVPAELAEWATRLVYSFGLLDIVEVAGETGHELRDVAGVYFVVSERFRVDDLLSRISTLPREDRWQTMARMALRYDLYAALAALTKEVLGRRAGAPPRKRTTAAGKRPPAKRPDSPELTAEERVARWEQSNAASITRTRNALREFEETHANLASLSVLLRQIRSLVRASHSH
jgi:glutamate dehydrogenase